MSLINWLITRMIDLRNTNIIVSHSSCSVSDVFSLLLKDLNNLLQAELQRTSSLMSQVKENKENTSKWASDSWVFKFQCLFLLLWLKHQHVECFFFFRELVETMEQNTQLRKQGSDLTLQNQNLVGQNKSLQTTHIWLKNNPQF